MMTVGEVVQALGRLLGKRHGRTDHVEVSHALPEADGARPSRTRAPVSVAGRDARRAAHDRLPTTPAARAALALPIGPAGWGLRSARAQADAPLWRRERPAIGILRRVWSQHDGWDSTQLRWREANTRPPAARCISSPDDPDAHDARPHPTPWVGSPVQLTAAYAEDGPPLITNVDPTIGPTAAGAATPRSHAVRPQRDLLPRSPLVDPGSLDADLRVERQDDSGVDRRGPTRLEAHWQARAGAGVDAQPVQIDGDQPHATGPAGQISTGWPSAREHRGHAVITVKGSTTDGRHGPP